MQNLRLHVRNHCLGYFFIFLGACIQLYLITRPLSFLLTNILPDDAFYYFEIARNVAHGFGSTFDGIHATNGYHPLWLLVLIGVYISSEAMHAGAEFPIRIALLVSVVCNVATGMMLYHLLRRYTGAVVMSACALVVWTLNPFVLYETINGLETSLSLFFLLLFMTLVTRFHEELSPKRLIAIGAVAGCMILARVDLVFYFIAVLVWIIATYGVHASMKKVLTVGLSASVLVVPWLLWNVIGFGMLLTSASEGNAFVNRALTHQHGVGGLFEIKHMLYHLYNYSGGVLQTTGMPTLFLLLLGIGISILLRFMSTMSLRWKDIPIEVALISGFALLFFADAGIRFTGRSWYFISCNVFLAMLCAVVFPYITSHIGKYKNLVLASLLFFIIGFFAIGWRTTLQDQMRNQLTMYEATLWGNMHLPKDAVLGAFNAGILGYFSTHTVVNLDGLVNNSALVALEHATLWEYMKQEKISYISDGEYYFTHRYSSFLGVTDPVGLMKPLAVFSVGGEAKASTFGVYQILK